MQHYMMHPCTEADVAELAARRRHLADGGATYYYHPLLLTSRETFSFQYLGTTSSSSTAQALGGVVSVVGICPFRNIVGWDDEKLFEGKRGEMVSFQLLH